MKTPKPKQNTVPCPQEVLELIRDNMGQLTAKEQEKARDIINQCISREPEGEVTEAQLALLQLFAKQIRFWIKK